jgi:cephalosporin hydroxylase
MRLTIDTDAGVLTEETPAGPRDLPLYSPEAFRLLSRQWVAVGWTQKYSYGFTWFGRPVVQLPEDLVRIQEVIWQVRPDVIVETGVAHGGSLVYYASLCKAMGRGRVVGVDIEIRPHNRAAVEAHPLADRITLIEGSSTAPAVLDRVRSAVRPGERVLVLLDSNHSKAHVLAELAAYAPLVSVGSYLVATDGVMADVAGLPGGRPDWAWDNPQAAARAFAAADPRFRLEDPPPVFNEGAVADRVTYWPSAYLKRVA